MESRTTISPRILIDRNYYVDLILVHRSSSETSHPLPLNPPPPPPRFIFCRIHQRIYFCTKCLLCLCFSSGKQYLLWPASCVLLSPTLHQRQSTQQAIALPQLPLLSMATRNSLRILLQLELNLLLKYSRKIVKEGRLFHHFPF